MPNYNDGKWHLWNGEDTKPAGIHNKSVVENIWHDERARLTGHNTQVAGKDEFGNSISWEQTLKFRVIKAHKEPREFWICPDQMLAYADDHRDDHIHVREVLE